MGCLIMFPSLRTLWPQMFVTTTVIPNNILINGNNNVSCTIVESGGVGPSINGLWWHLILLWNCCDNCIKEITKKFGHKVMGFIGLSILTTWKFIKGLYKQMIRSIWLWHKESKKHKLSNFGMGFWTKNSSDRCRMLQYFSSHNPHL